MSFRKGALLLALAATACHRAAPVPAPDYRPAVTAFYVSLAAMQTGQDVLARRELERVTQLAPTEAAAWANLGLLTLRQQQDEEAARYLAKASQLASDNAAIERLLALADSRKGTLDSAVRHWRRAIALDAADLKAPYALAQELERLGGPANDTDAQRVFEALAARSGNLAAQLEYARVAARRSDAAALAKALDVLTARAASWPADAQARLTVVRQAAQEDAARSVVFLKNVLIREPVYRAAFAAVSTPRAEIGEPIVRLIALKNPDPQPAPADDQLTFTTGEPSGAAAGPTVWAGAVWLTGDGNPALLAAGPRELRLAAGSTIPLAGGVSLADAGPDAIASVDLDYDFRTDLVVAGPAGLQIFHQNADATFSPATNQARLPASVTSAPLNAVWPADVDTDGDLDLIVATRDAAPVMLRNNSDGSFSAQSPFGTASRLRGFVWADLDGEGVPDAALLDDQGVLRVFLNVRGGGFVERPVPGQFPRVAAIAAADVSGDGIMDVVGVAADGGVTRLSIRPDGSGFAAARLAQADPLPDLAPGTARLLVADLDNNGAGDLVISSPAASRVLLAEPGGAYVRCAMCAARCATCAGEPGLPGGITAAADLDGDGRLELVARTAGGVRVVRVTGPKPYHWQAIRTRAMTATGDQRINSFGIGGEIEVRTGLNAQKQVIAAPVSHFGLGEAAIAEVARITWPNGFPQSEFDLAANATIGASQRLKGSCPWLFAWNGKEMGFVTDFIWRSPLGLRINAQATADVQMTEDWVRIRGDQLAARNGQYDLAITAELWETHFFDLVSLLVVDHPDGTEMFVDERFAVPPPRLGAIATTPVQALLQARDDQGRDVRDVIRARDDRYLDFAGRGPYQGVTRQHYVELELPDEAPRSGPLWLVATGWVHPTDSSVNVALGQGHHLAPAGLALHVADAAGQFRLARPGLGFPAGKDKTVLIDLAGIFPPAGPRRVRLSTNLEIFWDRIGWAAGRPDVTLQPRRLEMTKADLRFRGYSVTDQKDASTPERPRYVIGGVAARWRDLEGFHTRFGDVRELLQAVDDRYMIMNAGDELRLAFPEAPPPAPGMVRDYILVGDGWVKDGDFNTVASRTVLPLPTHRSSKYVQGTGRLEDDPMYLTHRDDFERFHTRYVSPDLVRDALRANIDRNHP
jgi:FG-GAP-like repeat